VTENTQVTERAHTHTHTREHTRHQTDMPSRQVKDTREQRRRHETDMPSRQVKDTRARESARAHTHTRLQTDISINNSCMLHQRT
jgi:hypothetical protein